MVERNLQARYHLDWPLWKQYLQYVGPFNLDERGPEPLGGDGSKRFGGVLVGDLGPSFKYRDYTVNDIIGQSSRSRCCGTERRSSFRRHSANGGLPWASARP